MSIVGFVLTGAFVIGIFFMLYLAARDFFLAEAYVKVGVIFFFSLLIAPASAVGLVRYWGVDTEISTSELISGFIMAKKSKICPLIEFR